MPTRVHHARLRASRTIARETREFVFSHDEDLPFRPGQFISVQVGIDEQGNPILRSYSLASPPERKGEFVLILSMNPAAAAPAAAAVPASAADLNAGPGSAFFAGLGQGDTIRFTGPMGFFVNDLSHPGDVVYAATGTGIAPILPMVQETLRRPEPGRVLLYWGVRHQADVFWEAEFRALAENDPQRRLTWQRHLSRPDPGYAGPCGRITGPLLAALPTLQKPIFYLCGNGHMIDEVKAALVARGVDRKRQVRTEAFFD